jgi:hypothetical protein
MEHASFNNSIFRASLTNILAKMVLEAFI